MTGFRRVSRWTALLLLAVGWLPLAVGCAATKTERPAGWEEAARAARLNQRSPASSYYHAEIARRYLGPLERAERSCSLRVPDTRGARFLLRLAADGTPAETLVHPDTEFARCLQREVGEVDLPPPPEPDHWVALSVGEWVP